MRRTTSLFGRLGGAACACILVATLCSSAHASEDLIITAAGTNLDGEQLKNNVQISAKLGVSAYDGTNHGWLHIRAHSITIDAGGSVDASGAGYRGNTAGAEGQPGAVGSAAPPGTPSPGGGGAHIGAGANGQDGNCSSFIGAEGGSPYDSQDNPLAEGSDPRLGMGSAGGTSHALPPNDSHDGAGANGGGVIILEAELIHIDGELHADGNPGSDPLDAAPGAGAGGTIIIRAHELVLGSTAKLSAIGGASSTATNPQSQFIYGGGGGGGLIVVIADTVTGDPVAISDVNGGQGAVGCTGATTGAPGIAVQQPGTGCIDADGDQHEAVGCGGDDCDDGDDTIYAGAKESCDGIDHNCDKDPVDNPDTLCPPGSGEVCDVNLQQCVPAGSGGGGQGGAEQGSTIELGGGLCAARRAPSPRGRHLGPWLLGLLGLAALGRRRRRR